MSCLSENMAPKQSNEHHFSGADIRSLVKKLRSSSKEKDEVTDQIPVNHKQQRVRRRTLTARPERAMNMAEARREIVAALKFHRASKQHRKETAAPLHQLSQANFIDFSPNYRYPVPSIQENSNFVLPDKALGLNLNLESFNLSDQSNPATAEEIQIADSSSTQLVNEKDIKSVDSVKTEWCFGFLNSMEPEFEERKDDDEEEEHSVFDPAMEFPPWINPNETCFQNMLHPACTHDSSPDSTLPWLEIEELDGDWLA